MPNPNYIKGVLKERDIVNKAREEGLIAFRSAGSHSPIDVCIIDIKLRRVKFIQCKPENFPESKKKKLEQEFEELNNHIFSCFFEVI